MANEVAKTFGDQLVSQLEIAKAALPKDFNQTRFVQNTLAVLNSNTDLTKCNRAQLLEGILKASYLGLDFSMKECYLIPYGNTANFQTSYMGEIKFTKKYSKQPIKDIYAKVVRKGDDYQAEIIDGSPKITFKPIPFNGEEIVGAFAVCLFADGTMIYEEMSTADINAVRNNYSKASMSKAWKSSWDEMAKKTVLRRLCKHIDTDFESVEAHQAWEDGSGMEFVNTSSAVDKTEVTDPFAEDNIIDSTAKEINEMDTPFGEVNND